MFAMVVATLDVPALAAALGGASVAVDSAAPDRRGFLLRPDLGRRLAEGASLPPGPYDVALVLTDGLSARAVQDHAPSVLQALLPLLAGWRVSPAVIARQARVALGDQVAAAMAAGAVVVLIGKRPGPMTTDAGRNCVSNIRPASLAPAKAAVKLAWMLEQIRARNLSGVALKDATEAGPALG